MKSTNSILGKGQIFDIDPIACMQHAYAIKNFIPEDIIEPWHQHAPEDQLLFKVAFISICHQFNWDFLQTRLYEKIFSSASPLLETIENITPSTISEWLHDYPKKERIHAIERAKLIRNVASVITENFNGSPKEFYDTLSQSSLGRKEFQDIMDLFDAYKKDPLKKKTNVLSHEITSERIFRIEDEGNLEPAVDYHIIRIYLRTGRVLAKDEELYKYFKGTPNPRGYIVSQLRKTVSDALKLTAHYANLNIAQVNFIEWQLGRSTCTNKTPRCALPPPNNAPTSIKKLFDSKCPYADCCTALTQMKEFIEFEEPLFFSTLY